MKVSVTSILYATVIIGMSRGDLDQIEWQNHEPHTCITDKNYTLATENGTKPFEVFVRITITDLYEISESKMDFGLQTFILETWKDPLLKLDGLKIQRVQRVPKYIMDCIWKPDIIFPNCKSARLYTVTIPHTVMKIIPGGYLYRYSRYHLTVNCQMDFIRYPMDTQNCVLNISLFATRSDEGDLYWMGTLGSKHGPKFMKEKPTINIHPGVEPMKFSMKPPTVSTRQHQSTTGNQTVLLCHFIFIRHLTASLVNIYIPSFLIVSLSMVSFWIDVNAVPGRVTLGVTSLLTLATEIVHARSQIPPVDYMTAMDIWLFGSMVMVFSSLIEFTMAQSYSRKILRKKKINPLYNLEQSTARGNHVWTSRKRKEKMESKTPVLIPTSFFQSPKDQQDNALDKFSRFFFPLALMIFVISYWCYYLRDDVTTL